MKVKLHWGPRGGDVFELDECGDEIEVEHYRTGKFAPLKPAVARYAFFEEADGVYHYVYCWPVAGRERVA